MQASYQTMQLLQRSITVVWPSIQMEPLAAKHHLLKPLHTQSARQMKSLKVGITSRLSLAMYLEITGLRSMKTMADF